MDSHILNRLVPLACTHMSGSGNDFVLIDNRASIVPDELAGTLTRLVCRRGLAVGADGVVLIEPATQPETDFRWRYINADGTDGELCGNGAMCAARFAFLHGIAPAKMVFETPSGLVHATLSGRRDDPAVTIAIDPPGPVRHQQKAVIAGLPMNFSTILVGVPHAVAVVDDADHFPAGGDFHAFGKEARYHPQFAPAGTNVDIITIHDRHTLRMRTWERGVEHETLACGTGAVASAVTAATLDLVEPPVTVIVSSGRRLIVHFELAGLQATQVHLEGMAGLIAEGQLLADALVE